MHDTAFDIGKKFFNVYLSKREENILEVGSFNVNGSLRDCAPATCKYRGVDIIAGPGVDIVLDDPNLLPFKNCCFDATVASSTLEHDQMFWLTFIEMARVTKLSGYIYLNVPSNGSYHGFPFDNWRFYPDAGLALVAWARKKDQVVSLVESFIATRKTDQWNDCVIIFRKGPIGSDSLPEKLLSDVLPGSSNIRTYRSNEVANSIAESEDMRMLFTAQQALRNQQHQTDFISAAEALFASVKADLTACDADLSVQNERVVQHRDELEARLMVISQELSALKAEHSAAKSRLAEIYDLMEHHRRSLQLILYEVAHLF